MIEKGQRPKVLDRQYFSISALITIMKYKNKNRREPSFKILFCTLLSLDDSTSMEVGNYTGWVFNEEGYFKHKSSHALLLSSRDFILTARVLLGFYRNSKVLRLLSCFSFLSTFIKLSATNHNQAEKTYLVRHIKDDLVKVC